MGRTKSSDIPIEMMVPISIKKAAPDMAHPFVFVLPFRAVTRRKRNRCAKIAAEEPVHRKSL